MASKRHQFGLFRVQTESSNLLKRSFSSASINRSASDFQFTADDKIIGPADNKTAALQSGLYPLNEPFVQHVMKKDVTEHGRNHPALRRSLIGICRSTSLHNSGIEPLADQTQYRAVVDPFLDDTSQKTAINVIEQSGNICAHDPTDVQLPALLPELTNGLVLIVVPAECMGKS